MFLTDFGGETKKRLKESIGVHWCTWKDLCAPKPVGGLGFRNFASFNLALLAK